MRGMASEQKCLAGSVALFFSLLTLASFLIACSKSEKPASQSVTQRTFASPEDAGAALLDAAKADDENAMVAIFGPEFNTVLRSGDAVKDKNALQDFIAAYNQMHRWGAIKAGGEILYIGADNFAFPVPLGKNSSGQWMFDTAAGKDEILARRIGRDELTAIAACQALADAQHQYFGQVREGEKVKQYAQKFVSDDGKQNGLYWPASDGQAPSPLENAHELATALGYNNAGDKPATFDGYQFRILTKQGDNAKGGAKDYVVNGSMTGGFAILAYPIEYRNSGIMTFVVGPDGVVYQKDLGENTSQAAAAMTAYNPEDSWKPAS
jgi:Protein of unknown function (DUF2950)